MKNENTEIQETQAHKKADTDHEIHPLIAHRWSPRVFAEKEVSPEKLHQLFEAARWAASSNNVCQCSDINAHSI